MAVLAFASNLAPQNNVVTAMDLVGLTPVDMEEEAEIGVQIVPAYQYLSDSDSCHDSASSFDGFNQPNNGPGRRSTIIYPTSEIKFGGHNTAKFSSPLYW